MEIVNDMFDRTFGLEIEMCNCERAQVALPSLYIWNKEERIINTDATCDKRRGGEINTPPLHLRLSELHELRNVYESLCKAGGVVDWALGLHVHIYAGDLSLEQLKKVFILFYLCYPLFRRYFHLTEWDELCETSQPIPTEEYYNTLLNAESFQSVETALTNSSPKGYIRYAVNIASFFKRKTIEFRCFRATTDFYEAMQCVYSAYRFFYYAVNHSIEDFRRINTYTQFTSEIRLKYNTPPIITPLLFQGNPYSKLEKERTKSLNCNRKQASALYNALTSNGDKEVCIVNGFLYFYELALFEKVGISIMCQDPYSYLLYILANGEKTVRYKGDLEWLEEYNNDAPPRQLAIALYAQELMKYMISANARNDAILQSLKLRAKESIEKTEKANERLMQMLTTCDFRIGTLQEAVQWKKNVFFNFGNSQKKQRLTYKIIAENSDLNIEFPKIKNEYYQFVEKLPSETHFYYFSNSPYLYNLNKVTVIDKSDGLRENSGRFLYSNVACKTSSCTSFDFKQFDIDEKIPPDDLIISDPAQLKILNVPSYYLMSLQKKYVKKVDKLTQCHFGYVVKYGEYTIGGFGFSISQHEMYDLFQLTDFCTNNNIPKLSKLILFCIQSLAVQTSLSRKLKKTCEKVLSYAYTHKPVSMKYRGAYRKVKEYCTPSHLAYEGILGQYATNGDILNKYLNTLNNGSK